MLTPWSMTTRPAPSVNQRPECEMVPAGTADVAIVVEVASGTRLLPDVDECEPRHAAIASDAAMLAETNVARMPGIGSDRRPRRERTLGMRRARRCSRDDRSNGGPDEAIRPCHRARRFGTRDRAGRCPRLS